MYTTFNEGPFLDEKEEYKAYSVVWLRPAPNPQQIISQYEPEPAIERVDRQREREGDQLPLFQLTAKDSKKTTTSYTYIPFVFLSHDVFHITFKMCSVLKSDNWTVMFF